LGGHFAKVFERPSFSQVARKRMDDREVLSGRRRHRYPRDAFRGRRERGEKRERKMADSVAEFGAVRPVPGVDGIEGFELGHAGVFDHADQIQRSIGNRPGAVREADQRKQRARRPDFGKGGAGGFERRERKDDVADGARANQKSTDFSA
jgi:hypothetical protein